MVYIAHSAYSHDNNVQLCDSLNSCSWFNSHKCAQQCYAIGWMVLCVCVSLNAPAIAHTDILIMCIHRGAFTVHPFTVSSVFILHAQFSFRSNRRWRRRRCSKWITNCFVNCWLFCTQPFAPCRTLPICPASLKQMQTRRAEKTGVILYFVQAKPAIKCMYAWAHFFTFIKICLLIKNGRALLKYEDYTRRIKKVCNIDEREKETETHLCSSSHTHTTIGQTKEWWNTAAIIQHCSTICTNMLNV